MIIIKLDKRRRKKNQRQLGKFTFGRDASDTKTDKE
jgi:hypothetical protein